MNRILYSALFLISVSISAFAQDVVTKRNGEQIRVKVIEISDSKVTYRLENEPDGPVYSIRKSSIDNIKYNSGRVETFDIKAPSGKVLSSYVGAHHYEIGGGINIFGILGAVGGPERSPGPGFYFEYRYAFAEHFDVGGQLNYKCGQGQSAYAGPGSPTFRFFNNQIAIKAIADYNICPSRLANPYIGIGAGAGYMFSKRLDNNEVEHYPYGTIGGRFGVQVWRFRIAIECDFALTRPYGFSPEETSTALNLSYAF